MVKMTRASDSQAHYVTVRVSRKHTTVYRSSPGTTKYHFAGLLTGIMLTSFGSVGAVTGFALTPVVGEAGLGVGIGGLVMAIAGGLLIGAAYRFGTVRELRTQLRGMRDASPNLMRGFFSVMIAIAGACQPASVTDVSPDPPAQPQVRFERDMMIRFHMHQDFDLVRAIERLLVRGKLDDAKALAGTIARSPDEPGLAPWARQVASVRERASEIVSSISLDDAIRRTAALGAACASCHVDAGALPEFRRPPRMPDDRQTVESRMARHLWAVDRLWEGAVGGADEPWVAGLDVLAMTPLPFGAVDSDRTLLAHQLQRLADTARKQRTTDTPADRARGYGEILVTCAACHTATAKK